MDIYQTLAKMDLTNYTMNGAPVALYGMIGFTTLLLSYVTFSGMGGENEEEEKPPEEPKEKVEDEEKEPEEPKGPETELEKTPTEEDILATEQTPVKEPEVGYVPSVGMMPQPIPVEEPTSPITQTPEEKPTEPSKPTQVDGGKMKKNKRKTTKKGGKNKSQRRKSNRRKK